MTKERDASVLAGLILSVGIPVAAMAAELLVKALKNRAAAGGAGDVPVVEAGLLYVGQLADGKIVVQNRSDRDVVLTFQKSDCTFEDGEPNYTNESVAATVPALSGAHDISPEMEAFAEGGEMSTNYRTPETAGDAGGLARFFTRIPVWASTVWSVARDNLTVTRGVDASSGKAWIKFETTSSISNIMLSLTDAAGKRFSKSRSNEDKSAAGAGTNVYEIEIPPYIDIYGIMQNVELNLIATNAAVRGLMTKELPRVAGVDLAA